MNENTTYISEQEWTGCCPKCGCDNFDCCPDDFDGHEISSGSRDVPPDYEYYWMEFVCPDCGHTVHVICNESPDDAHALDEDILRDRRFD